MVLNLKQKLSALWKKHIVQEFDVERAYPRLLQRLYFNLNTQNTNYTRELVSKALALLEFSKWKYRTDPALDPYKKTEVAIKYIIDNNKISVLAKKPVSAPQPAQ